MRSPKWSSVLVPFMLIAVCLSERQYQVGTACVLFLCWWGWAAVERVWL